MKQILLLLFAPLVGGVQANHIIGGEFQYTHVEGFTYTIEFIQVANSSAPVDEPRIILFYGDGALDTLSVSSSFDSVSCRPERRLVFSATHTYPGPGSYRLTAADQNRNSGIVNVPNSIAQSFCVEALLVIDPLLGPGSSPLFESWSLCPEIVWSTLVHDPLAFDPDGDSLSFALTVPLGLGCAPIGGYSMPMASPNGWVWLDPESGSFQWHMPPIMGEFTIAITANKWRNGVLLGRVTRDMNFTVISVFTGMEELDQHMPLLVRPTVGDGNIWITNSDASAKEITVVDASGRRLHGLLVPVGDHYQDLAWLGSGAYILRNKNGQVSRFMIH